MRDIPILVLVLFAACRVDVTDDSGDPDPPYVPSDGRSTVCVTTDTPDLYQATGEVTGLVSGGGEGYEALESGECWGTPARFLDLVDPAGHTWRAGWGLTDDQGTDVSPEVHIPVDGPVQLRSRVSCGEGCSAAFSIVSGELLYAAFTEGYWGPAFEEGDLPGLTVSAGGDLGLVDTGCGLEAYTTQVFDGDTRVELEPFATGTVQVGGEDRRAWAISAHRYEVVKCTDVGDTFAWGLSP